jgi:uncharacterized phosphosugar-binding protein
MKTARKPARKPAMKPAKKPARKLEARPEISVRSYGERAIPHLWSLLERNEKGMARLADRLARDVAEGKRLLVFGSGHSAIFPMELYHRAGGASFVVPVIADYLLPTAGPPVVRLLERTPGAANAILGRMEPKKGETLWLASNSGINAAVVDLALEARRRGLRTAAFTSLAHSEAVSSRHPSGKRLFEVCDDVIDIGGVRGDAAIPLTESVAAGPLSTLSTVLLGHSILVSAMAQLERSGHPCVYTSVNTPEGETRNKKLEEVAARHDYLLR